MHSPDPIGRLIEGFVGEAGDLCEAITRDLLALEHGGDDIAARYENVARGLHTLKGGAGTLGLDDLERLAHRLESAFLPHQARKRPLASEGADALLRGLDAFMFRLRAHAEGRGAELDDIEKWASASQAPTSLHSARAGDPTAETIDDALPQAEPAPGPGAHQTWRVAPEQIIALMKEVERLRFLRLRLGERRRSVSQARATLGALSRGRGDDSGEAEGMLTSIEMAIAVDAQEVADVVQALEEGVKNIGTQPLRVIVEPLHRAVRDMCRSSGKEAKLSLVGGETCLDRRVLESLKGPIVHLIRNAVAHGIELPAERRARGKHEEGAIVIRAEQQGNVVFIEVSDDGAGLKLDAIKRAALERGVATEAALASMPPEKVYRLIFLPTVSTAREVTATSGRGIGMDAVEKGVEELHGHVEVQTTAEQGTRVLLTFPAGLGSSQILIVRTDDYEVGIPMLSVEGIMAAKPSSLVVGDAETSLRYQNELLPVMDLGAALGLRPPRPVAGGRLLIIHSQGKRVALWVNDLVGDMDLAIRALPREVAGLRPYQGASSLAGGELILILRPDWLTAQSMPPASRSASAALERALVVDDSLTARALHRATLELGGYTVHEASSGPQALDRLTHARYDVIVCDLGMSPTDGLELVRALRERPDTREVPVLVVSARGDEASRQQALAAGADGFLGKAHCASGGLLAEMGQIVLRRKGAA